MPDAYHTRVLHASTTLASVWQHMPLVSCHLSIITLDVLSECCTTCNCRCTDTNTACVITTNEAFPLIYRSSRLKKCEEARSPSLYVV